jgi:hypothetical protein
LEKQKGKAGRIGNKGTRVPSIKSTAKAAGISSDQAKDMLRVANIPKDQFELAVEAANPPSIKQLAEKGKKATKKRKPDPHREEYLDWCHAIRSGRSPHLPVPLCLCLFDC